jgi:plasmid maintenance system killer protein
MNKLKVIYIVGEGRSGSTLLERLLGQHSKIFSAGELKHIWERSFLDNQLCSCGKSFYDCEIWTEIRKNFTQKIDNVDPKEIMEAFNKTSRLRHYILKKNLDNQFSKVINNIYTKLYESILETTEKEFVIDASKHPVFAHILGLNKNIDLYIIHLVRDSRGVTYSWLKKKKRPEITKKIEYMPRYSFFRTAISWNIINKISQDLQNIEQIKYFLLRYEDFVSNPKLYLGKIYKFLNIESNLHYLFKKDNTIKLSVNHTVSGNPFRFKTGEIELKLDEEWKKNLNPITRKLVTITTYPYLKKYGYIK